MRRPTLSVLSAVFVSALLFTPAVLLAQSPVVGTSPYSGQEARRIKVFSDEDLQALRTGAGWGLAKPAELNGLPGPTHLLELREAIPLSAQQVLALETLFADMNARAREQGARLIALETALDEGFAQGTVTPERLRGLLGQIATVRADLRFTHLSTHLETPPLLSQEQIARYNALRGYAIQISGSPNPANPAMPTTPAGQGGQDGKSEHSGHGGHKMN